MSRARLMVGVSFALVSKLAFAQQSTAPPTSPSPQRDPQAVAYLQKALSALAPATPISDITLSGTARRIAGSDDESGTVVVKILAGGGSRVDLSFPSGPRSEVRNTSSPEIAGSWSGPDGVPHAAAYHNLLNDPGWCPAFTIASLLSAQHGVITYVGPETRDGQSVIHISASQHFPDFTADAKTASLMQHLTQTEVFLDPNTSLPVALVFQTHPDADAGRDVPVAIRFSNYTPVNGAQVPFHIEKFLNNSLFLDVHFDSATLNSGLTASDFTSGGAQ